MQYVVGIGKGLMLPRLALLVAAALIFAPYETGGEPPEPSRGADLAARVLAPTFDEGAIRGAAKAFNHQLTSRDVTRFNGGPSLVLSAETIPVGIAVFALWLLRVEQIRLVHSFYRATRVSRGPPLLRFA